MQSRKAPNKRKKPDDSEEELVFFTKENSLTISDGGITKKMEFAVTETHTRGNETSNHMRIKPWESSKHAS